MAWTDPRTWVAGEIVTAAIMNTHVRDNLDALAPTGGVWTNFVPVLQSTGTQPVLGSNGNIADGRWTQIGNTVFVQGQLRYGDTGETIGTGNYVILFGGIANGPPNAQITMGHVATDGLPLGTAVLNDNNAAVRYMLHVQQYSATQVWLLTNREPASAVGVSSPITVAELDRFRFSFHYEAA